MNIPIIFIHTGYSDYMEYSLRQARHSNPDGKIILLGDEKNNCFDFITHEDQHFFFTGADKFRKIYRHFSTNSYHYEIFCIQRWFILEEYMRENSIPECFVCDTDVMIYSDINRALEPFSASNISIVHQDEKQSMGISFLRHSMLKDFCAYITRSYNNPTMLLRYEKYYINKVKESSVGGISDMTLLADWLKDTHHENVMNLLQVFGDATFDLHIGNPLQISDDRYKTKRGHKAISWKKNIPYCYSYKHSKQIRFHLLHFQGPAKYYMATCYKGHSFHNKTFLDAKFYVANLAAFLYKILRIRYRFNWLFQLYFSLKYKQKQHQAKG